MFKINSHNEWDTLKECIVGTAKNTHATFTWESGTEIDPKKFDEAIKITNDASPSWFYDEVTEDLNNLAKTLEDLSPYKSAGSTCEDGIISPFISNSSSV